MKPTIGLFFRLFAAAARTFFAVVQANEDARGARVAADKANHGRELVTSLEDRLSDARGAAQIAAQNARVAESFARVSANAAAHRLEAIGIDA